MVKIHLGIFRQVAPGTSQEAKDKWQVLVDEKAAGVQKYYRHFGRHVWDIQVRGFVMEGEESCHPPLYARGDINRFLATIDDFEPNYFQVWGGYSSGYCGQANLGGNWGAVYLNYSCGLKVHIHEFGHNLGFGHADTINGAYNEYGDEDSIMGRTTSLLGLTSPHIIQAGWALQREILEVTETTQTLICPLEMSQFGMHENEHQHIIIKKQGYNDYHLSMRKEGGTLYPSSRTADHTVVYAHEVADKGHAIRHEPDFKLGSKRQLPNGVTVIYHEYSNETARVDIRFDINEVPDDIDMPIGFPPVPRGSQLGSSHTGAWYNKYYNGQGFDVHIHDDILVLFWYTYNERDSSLRFYTAQSSWGSDWNEFDIYTSLNGTWEDPTESEEVLVGKGQLYFFDDNNGIFNYDLHEDDKGRGSIELTRVAPSVSGGVWYQKSRDGEGFSVQIFEDLDRVAVWWYTYGLKQHNGSNWIPGSEQRWYSCEGTILANGSYELVILEAHTGRWLDPDDIGLAHEGVANMKPVGDNMEFSFQMGNKQGTYTLERLF